MIPFPQLRIRTEFSFRAAFGPVPRLADHLVAIGCKTAAIVDSETWGHVRFEKELVKKGIQPGFGAEFKVVSGEYKLVAWCLAEDLAGFYRFTSTDPVTPEQWATAPGVLRFAGAALKDPALFDYIDLNPASILRARDALTMAKTTKKPVILTSDNSYPALEDRHRFMAIAGNTKMTPQHLLSEKADLRKAFFFLTTAQFNKAYKATFEVAERLQGLKLAKAPLIQAEGDLAALAREGKAYRLEKRHISCWNKIYEDRLERELAMIAQKKFDSYFIVVADLVCWAKTRMLVGPARGSSAGSLVCYLLRITEVDPIVHGLLFERFIDVSRNDLPDIDIDFNDTKRKDCFDYLEQKYGTASVARLGSVNTLQPLSVMAEVGKRVGISGPATYKVRDSLIDHAAGDARYGKSLEDTFTLTEAGKDFFAQYPESRLMAEVENHAWHSGVHAAGFIVSNVDVTQFCTVSKGIAQIDKPDAEYLNLLKIDILGLSTLGVIEDTGCITPEELYSLPLNDPKTFDLLNSGRFSGVFQFEGAAQRRIAQQVPISEFKQVDHLTALARPGPMGGGATERYIKRNAGAEVTYKHPMMVEILGDTLGVIVYQEQVMRIAREIGGFNWEEVSVIRKGISQSKGREFIEKFAPRFAEGAAKHGIPMDIAYSIWDEIYSFGAYGMNMSHTCSYAIISMWCAYMKVYHPMEYAAACLRKADGKPDSETRIIEILREFQKEGIDFVAFDPLLSAKTWAARDGKLFGGYMNLNGLGAVKATKWIMKRDTQGLNEKDLEALAKMRVKVSELRPAHAKYSYIYDHPAEYSANGVVNEFADLKDQQSAIVVCRLISKERRDENEPQRLVRRGGERKTGETQFLNAMVVDDSISKPITLRVRAKYWRQMGRPIAEHAQDGSEWFLARGKWLQEYTMFTVERMRCLTNPELFNETT